MVLLVLTVAEIVLLLVVALLLLLYNNITSTSTSTSTVQRNLYTNPIPISKVHADYTLNAFKVTENQTPFEIGRPVNIRRHL